MKAAEESRRWMIQVEADRKTIDVLYAGERYYMVCFLCQQTVEKALKAVLYLQGEDPVFGHSVTVLCDRCAAYDEAFSDLKSRIKNLDQFYIEARYPNGLPDQAPVDFFDASDADDAITMTDLALATVRQKVRGGSREQ